MLATTLLLPLGDSSARQRDTPEGSRRYVVSPRHDAPSALANYTDVITLGVMGDTLWWSCAACGSYAELPAVESEGFDIPCPDCRSPMTAQWFWEAQAAEAA
jgi:hypothetical protein